MSSKKPTRPTTGRNQMVKLNLLKRNIPTMYRCLRPIGQTGLRAHQMGLNSELTAVEIIWLNDAASAVAIEPNSSTFHRIPQ